ncbi:MAG: hypothetical protein ACXQTY_05450 [Candidatus Methanogasteraceae archaeon]
MCETYHTGNSAYSPTYALHALGSDRIIVGSPGVGAAEKREIDLKHLYLT